MTLYEVLYNNGQRQQDETAFTYFKHRESYGKLLENTEAFASGLKKMGIEEGERVGICLVNSPAFFTALYAINKIGAVSVLLNPKTGENQLMRQLDMTDCRAVIYSDINAEEMKRIYKRLQKEQKVSLHLIRVPVLKYVPPLFYPSLIQKCSFIKIRQEKDFYEIIRVSIKNIQEEGKYYKKDSSEAVILFSGGTSGELKAVVYTADALNKAAQNALKSQEPIDFKVSMLSVLPGFHIFGLVVAVHLPIVAGGEAVLVPFFHMDTIAKILVENTPCYMAAVPIIIERLLDSGRLEKYGKRGKNNLKNFRLGYIGGDFLDVKRMEDFNCFLRERECNGRIVRGYGLSECCPVCVEGELFSGTQCKIVEGEICISSEYMMEYCFNEKKEVTRPIMEQGRNWIYTKDTGEIDEQGRLILSGRQRRIIKVSGHTVFLQEVEKVMDDIDMVEKSYAVRVADKKRGNVVFAFVSLKDKRNCNEKNKKYIMDECRKNMVIYAVPWEISYIDGKEIPVTVLGKVAWGILEQRAQRIMNKKYGKTT